MLSFSGGGLKGKAISHCSFGGATVQWMFSPKCHLLFHEKTDLLDLFLCQGGICPHQFRGCMLYFRDSVPLVKLDVEFDSSYFCFFLTLQPLLFLL